VAGVVPEAARFASFATGEDWLPFGAADTGELVRLMRSRRSCRNYLPEPVPRDMLADLTRIGATAPSGTNSQRWTFTILPDRAAVVRAGAAVGGFFRRLNARAANPWLRNGLALLGRRELAEYYRTYFASVGEALRLWDETGRDLLFHGASAALAVGSLPGASCPAEDALLATQNMLLAAHSMGLGSCLIGFAVEAARRDPAVPRAMGLPAGEVLHAVIALGWPDERWTRVAGRRMPLIRWADGEQGR
jgi:nitroreductase